MSPDVTLPCIVAFAPRERARSLVKAVFPRRRTRLIFTRTPNDFASAFRKQLVDAALVDVASPHDDTWTVAAFAREFPSAPFFALTSLRAVEAPAVAQCAEMDFADVLVEGIDDACARDIVSRRGFSARFADALRAPPNVLALTSDVQQRAWEYIVAQAGRRVRTLHLARRLGVTRE